MQESYWFDYNVTDLLFKGLDIHSVGGFIFVCVILLISAGLFEAVKLCQITVKLKALILLAPANLNLFCFNNDQSQLLNNSENARPSVSKNRVSLFLCEVVLYMGQVLLGYLLMLVIMTFNGYFTIALVTGAGIGYFFFGFECAQTKVKMAKLKLPCQQCIQNNREDSAVSTLVENESVAGNSSANVNCSMHHSPNTSQANVDVHASSVASA